MSSFMHGKKYAIPYFSSLLLPIFTWSNRTMLRTLYSKFKVDLNGAAILSKVGLYNQDEQEVNFRLYNTSIHTWTSIQIGHIITLRDGNHIFLNHTNVIHCLDFDNLLSCSQGRNPHFSRNLTHDHVYSTGFEGKEDPS